MQVTFPHLLLRQETRFWLEGMSLEPQQSISGTETIVPAMRARWMASCSFVLKGEAQRLAWEAFTAQMEGRVGTTLVPAHYRWRPRDRDGHHLAFCDVAGIAGAQTWEHFGLEGTNVLRAWVATSAPLRATQIDMRFGDAEGVRPGQKISIGDRLHRIQSTWRISDTIHRATIQPPLRAAAGAGTRIEIETPACLMRMTTETEGIFDQSLSVLPTVTVNFQEAI